MIGRILRWIVILAVIVIIVTLSYSYFIRSEGSGQSKTDSTNSFDERVEQIRSANRQLAERIEDFQKAIENHFRQEMDVSKARALQWRDTQIRFARRHFGADAPTALLASQIEAESSWRKEVSSPVGARGLAQFMPATAQGMSDKHQQLEGVKPTSARWALRAQSLYLRDIENWLHHRIGDIDQKQKWPMMLSIYNGGFQSFIQERNQSADGDQWYQGIDQMCARSEASWMENRTYIPKVVTNQSTYQKLGWSGKMVDYPKSYTPILKDKCP